MMPREQVLGCTRAPRSMKPMPGERCVYHPDDEAVIAFDGPDGREPNCYLCRYQRMAVLRPRLCALAERWRMSQEGRPVGSIARLVALVAEDREGPR